MGRPARSAKQRPALVRPRVAATPPRSVTPTRPAPDVASLLQAAVAAHQAGNVAEAERLYRRVLDADPDQPDGLHLLGVLALQVGRADVAVPLIERAVALRPAAPAYRLNLGNALLTLGRPAEAVESYRQGATLAPTDPEAHYNLGNALIQLGEADAGIAELRHATRLNPGHLAAQYNLGNALHAAGRHEDAVTAYRVVVARQPGHADAETNLAAALHALGRDDEAQACLERALAANPDHALALVNLASALREQDRLDEAAPYYRRALAVDPDNLSALRGLAAIHQTQKKPDEAAELLGRLVARTPDDPLAHLHYARELHAASHTRRAVEATLSGLDRCPTDLALARWLVDLLQVVDLHETGPAMRAALLVLSTDDTFDAQWMATPIVRIVAGDPEYPALLAAARAGADPFATGVPLPPSLLAEPAVLAALPRVVICSPDVERILTVLRRFTLLRTDLTPRPPLRRGEGESLLPLSAPERGPGGEVFPFLCALARAAFLVEHTWLIQPDEAERLATIREMLTTILADPAADLAAHEDLLLLAALYDRLGRLPGAERLAAVPEDRWSPPFAAVIREQVAEPLAERAIAADLVRLTPISDAVSQAVQAMYEENPYPRWRAAAHHSPEPLADRFRRLCPDEPVPDWPSPLPVLIAGAGTGQHPIQTALRLPEADVLAVDLSRTSLAYGARMAERISLPNLTFAQADILALDALERRFALIESCGVLHHMADPLAGWAVLRRLLRPDGLMLIALYSELARQDVVAARARIAAEDIPSSADGIKAARRHILDLPPDHPMASLTRFRDFYSESGFRDLTMHVQEHRFTIPRLAAALDALDLRFLGFVLAPAVLARFRERFPAPGAERDLACWDQFEHAFPDTFAEMYQLWCRPR